MSPFCDLNIGCNFNVALQPLSVSKHVNQDKVLVSLICQKPIHVACKQNGNAITINSAGEFVDCLCVVEAPIKANFDVVTIGGSINVGSFENDFLKVHTDVGNVEIDKFQSADFDVFSGAGDVTCKTNVQAMNICLQTKSGNIRADKLQGRNLKIATDSGCVTTQASYCDESAFSTKTGRFYLQNAHKNCKIVIEETGYLSLVVFDGKLEAVLNSGTADVFLSRILADSFVSIKEGGVLNLKVVENCFDNTAFRIETKTFETNLRDYAKQLNVFVVEPKQRQEHVFNVACRDGCVTIEQATVLDLFRLLK